MQVAAALAFHLPGARLDLSGHDGAFCSVGPLTDPRCMLHPAEFREMVVSNAGMLDSISSPHGGSLGASPTLSLTSIISNVRHVGSGLYRIAGSDLTSYAFATLLPAQIVDSVLSRMQTRLPDEHDRGRPSDPLAGDELIAVNLIHDEGLRVTLVVMCSNDVSDKVTLQIARSAVAACLVTEVEFSLQPY